MADLKVDDEAVAVFAATLDANAGVVGTDCTDTGAALGSGVVRDALGNVSLVLTLLDQALADGASSLATAGRSSEQRWVGVDARMASRAV